MGQIISQAVFKPNPGADMTKFMGFVSESVAIWRKHGADVSIWAVSAGEVGNMVFSARYDSFEAYGKCTRCFVCRPCISSIGQAKRNWLAV